MDIFGTAWSLCKTFWNFLAVANITPACLTGDGVPISRWCALKSPYLWRHLSWGGPGVTSVKMITRSASTNVADGDITHLDSGLTDRQANLKETRSDCTKSGASALFSPSANA
jgi:hypothetical protein